MKVLIFVDQGRRDYIVASRLKKKFQECGVMAIVVNHYTLMPSFYYFNPDIVLLGNVDLYHSEWAAIIATKAFVFSIPTEQLIEDKKGFVDRIIQGHSISDKRVPAVSHVDCFMLYGSYQEDAFLSTGIEEDRVFVSGSPRAITKVIKTDDRFTIGIALESEDYSNIERWIYQNGDQVYSDWGGGVEVLLSSKIILQSKLFEVANLLRNEFKVKIIYRARLSLRNGVNYLKKDSYTEVDCASSPQDFFDNIDLLIVGQTNLGTEAQIAGIPVVSVIDFNSTNSYCVNECLSKRERFKYFYSPKTNDELFEIVKRASENRLAVSKDISGFNKFVRDRYGLQLSDEGGYDVTLPIDSMVDFVVDFINKNEKKMNKNNRLIGFGYTHLFGLNRFKFLGKMIAYVDRKSPIFLSRAVHSLLYFVIIYTYRILYSIRLIDRFRFNYL